MAKQLPQNRSLLKSMSKLSLAGRLIRGFLACILPILPLKILTLATASASEYYYVGVSDLVLGFAKLPWALLAAVLLVRLLVANPMQVKMSEYFLLNLKNPGKKFSPLMVCECFSSGYFRQALAMMLLDALNFLCVLLPLGVQLLLPGMLVWESYGQQTIPVLSAYPFGLLIGSVLMVVCTLVFSQVPFLLSTRPELSVWQVFSESIRLTRGRLWELFVLRLSFTGWMLLDSITYVAGIFYYPYLYMTQAAYFLAFTGQEIPGPARYSASSGFPFVNSFDTQNDSSEEDDEEGPPSSEDSHDEN